MLVFEVYGEQMSDFKLYLKNIHFDKYLKKLNKKLKNKKIILYGTGTFFKHIQENYNLDSLNIIGVSDLKFKKTEEGEKYLNYKIIPLDKIIEYAPDYILVATMHYEKIIDNFEINILNKTKIKAIPLARKNLWDLIKEIWVD